MTVSWLILIQIVQTWLLKQARQKYWAKSAETELEQEKVLSALTESYLEAISILILDKLGIDLTLMHNWLFVAPITQSYLCPIMSFKCNSIKASPAGVWV